MPIPWLAHSASRAAWRSVNSLRLLRRKIGANAVKFSGLRTPDFNADSLGCRQLENAWQPGFEPGFAGCRSRRESRPGGRGMRGLRSISVLGRDWRAAGRYGPRLGGPEPERTCPGRIYRRSVGVD